MYCHYLVALKNMQIFKRIVKCQTFLHWKMGNWPWLNVQKNIFSWWTFFGHVLTILAWTKCRLVTKHALFRKHLYSYCFLTFPLKYCLYKEIQLINFWRSIHLSFQSHQMCTFSAGFEKARNWDRLSLSGTIGNICHKQNLPENVPSLKIEPFSH